MNAHDELMTMRGAEVRDMTTGEHRGRREVTREKSEIADSALPDTRQSGIGMVCPRCGSEEVSEVTANSSLAWYLACVVCGWRSEVVVDAFTAPAEVLDRYAREDRRSAE